MKRHEWGTRAKRNEVESMKQLNLNKLLAAISAMAAIVIVLTFLGQSAAFHSWVSLSALSVRYTPKDPTAVQDLQNLLSQSAPRLWDWMMIRVLSVGILAGALSALWIERGKKHVT
jgi:hypothetical protein